MKGLINMATYEYETKKGTKYGARGYLGIDELTGKQVNVNKRGFNTRKEADVYFLREKLKFEDGERKEKAKAYTFQEVYEQWLDVYQNTVKESTLNKTKQYFDLHILVKFGDLIITKITPRYIQTIVNQWHKEFQQYRRLYNLLNRVMIYATTQRIIKENPCDLVVLPTNKVDYGYNKVTKDFYTKTELQHFLKVVQENEPLKWYAMFRLFAFSGIRRGELLALTWDDISFKEGTLSVNKALAMVENNKLLVQSPKNETSKRTITLDETTIQTLKRWKYEQAELLIGFGYNAMKPNQLLFNNASDNQHLYLSAPRNALSRICEKHNLEMINIHGFRHTHCSLLFEAGVPMKDVKERLGHSDIQTTMNIYTHVTQESRDKSAELFANYVNF